MRNTLLLAAAAAGLLLTPPLPGGTLVNPINKDSQGVALKGYDPVAYFDQSKPVKGSPSFTHQWMGATWQFASAEHRDLFAKNADKYAPRFGGYCAYAVSQGYTADIDPEAWKIVEGKLYVNYSKAVREKWAQDLERRIGTAEKNWPTLHK